MSRSAFQLCVRLRHQRGKINKKLWRAEVLAFPVGSTAHYQHGNYWREGVVQWNESGRVKLLTPAGKEVVIDVSRLQP